MRYLVLAFAAALVGMWACHTGPERHTSARSAQPAAVPDLRNESRLLARRDEHGRIPPRAMMRAKAQIASLPQAATTAGLDPKKWTNAGPGNVGGRIRAIAIHPQSSFTIFIGSVSGGIWKTTNAGLSWSPVDDNMGNLAITSILFHPLNPKIMYASTGEGVGESSGTGFTALVRGAGIFRSADGGRTWSQLPSTDNANFYWVNRLSISSTGATLLAATGKGLYRSTNGGASWTKTSASVRSFDVRFHPSRSNVAVAHAMVKNAVTKATESRVLYSSDGGARWSNSNLIRAGRIELAWHAGYTGSGNGCVYAQSNGGENNTELFRSVDGGRLFWFVSKTDNLGKQGWYGNALWVAPYPKDAVTSNDRILSGGVHIFRSFDGGKTFTNITKLNTTSIHVDHHAIVPHPRYDGRFYKGVYFGNDGGIYYNADVFSTAARWFARNSNLGITQFYGGSRHAGSDTLYGGTQDNGTLSLQKGAGFNGWARAFGGDGGYAASDPTSGLYHYGEMQWGRVHRSSDGGKTAERIWGYDGASKTYKKPPYIITDAADIA